VLADKVEKALRGKEVEGLDAWTQGQARKGIVVRDQKTSSWVTERDGTNDKSGTLEGRKCPVNEGNLGKRPSTSAE